jgi:hypothetical protein
LTSGRLAAGVLRETPTIRLRFKGSRIERFITGSFDHTLTPGCSTTIAN